MWRERARWQAFRDIELPLIAPGIFGAASFSLIISINETVRTSVVQGALEHDPDLYLVDLQAGRPVAGALRADGPDHPRDHRARRRLRRDCPPAPSGDSHGLSASAHHRRSRPRLPATTPSAIRIACDDPRELHGGEIGALVCLELLLAAQLLEHLRHLLGRVGHMNEAARDRAAGSVRRFRAGCRGRHCTGTCPPSPTTATGMFGCQQCRLDFAHRQGREARARRRCAARDRRAAAGPHCRRSRNRRG